MPKRSTKAMSAREQNRCPLGARTLWAWPLSHEIGGAEIE